MAGDVSQQLWQHWDENVDVFNVNVPLGFKDASGAPVRQEVIRSEVDMVSSYQTLYSELSGLRATCGSLADQATVCSRLIPIAVCQDAAHVKTSLSTAPTVIQCSTLGGCVKGPSRVNQAANLLVPQAGQDLHQSYRPV